MQLNKKIIKSFIFVVGLTLIFGLTQKILCSKTYEGKMREFYELEKDTVDVIFLGTSHMMYGVSPVELYQTNNITSYNLGTALQPIEVSYYLLNESLHYQTPKLVVLDASNLFREDSDGHWWQEVMDGMPLSFNKLDFALTYSKGENNSTDGLLSAVFPFYQYHTRWNELTRSDFTDHEKTKEFYLGYSPSYFSEAVMTSLDEINESVENSEHEMNLVQYNNGIKDEVIISENDYYINEVSENGLKYLLKMKEVCDSKGIQLLLVKVPTTGSYEYNPSTWSMERSKNLQLLGDNYQIQVLDLMYDAELGINWEKDSIDGGMHLNIKGASKVTSYLANYLNGQYNLPKEYNIHYEDAIDDYNDLIQDYNLLSEDSFSTYLNLLNNYKGKYAVLCAGTVSFMNSTEINIKNDLENLGLHSAYDQFESGGYVAFIQDGKVLYEGASDLRLKYEVPEYDNQITLFATDFGIDNKVKIDINEAEYSIDQPGMIIILYDMEKGVIFDKAYFLLEDNQMRNFSFE